jgi:glycosyltransferase involved in cell wall biosynthesis
MGQACRDILPQEVEVRQVGPSWVWSGRHFRDSLIEYLLSPRLALGLPGQYDAVILFGAPALVGSMALLLTGRVGKLAYFCYEPPRMLYTDRQAIGARLGVWKPVFFLATGPLAMLDRMMVGSIPLLLTNSRYNQLKLRVLYGKEAHVITHGVDLPLPLPETVSNLRASLSLEPHDQVVLTVNHLHPRKRIDLYLRVLEGLKALYPKVVGVIVGDGVERGTLTSMASRLGLSRSVRFVGWVPEADLPAYYKMASVYLHTAKEESFGLSVIEAMASGVPVVAVAEGGPTETVVDGITGFLVPAAREELIEKVAYLLSDSSRAATMGARARQAVLERYSWERGVADLLGALEGCPQ